MKKEGRMGTGAIDEEAEFDHDSVLCKRERGGKRDLNLDLYIRG